MRLSSARPLVALLLLIPIALASLPTPSAAQTGQIEGPLPTDGGFALIVWGGGSAGSLIDGARAQGCLATTGWIAIDGTLIGYVHGAPDLVNSDFRSRFPDGLLPPGTAVVLVCAPSGPASAAPAQAPPPPTFTSPQSSEPAPALPAPPPPATAAAAPPAATSLEQQYGVATFEGINATRRAGGLAPLTFNASLTAAAEQYARFLFDTDQFSHSADGEPWDRAQRAGYPSTIVGEVLASIARTEVLEVGRDAGILVQSWIDSAPHYAIIMGVDFAFTELGTGCALGPYRDGMNMLLCVALAGQP